MNSQAEQYLQKVIFPDLERGRPNWDKPHTQSVVAYVERILDANPALLLDEEVLTIAAYAHDWGYADLFDHGAYVSGTDIANQKAVHMVIGAQKIKALLKESAFHYLSAEQKERIEHLVFVHDKLTELTHIDELILMEADSLGVADIDGVTPTLNKSDHERWLIHLEKERISRFLTDYSKNRIRELLEKRAGYYDNLPQ